MNPETGDPGPVGGVDRNDETEDFGHRPVVSFIDGRALNRVCARCTTHTATGIWGVRWPCTSAIILGLVPRPVSGSLR
jgi:hypothetical protein